jgi:ATP-binding cassette subfamily F protein uup
MPVKALSGGEQNRAVLAHLFSKSANLLVLDEPTNDLDIETLELLEEILLGFEGTVLLVSHDRDFMDNVITSLIVLDGQGNVNEYVGGYSDWEARGGSLSDAKAGASAPVTAVAKGTHDSSPKKTTNKPAKLSYKDQRELGSLPAKIEKLETQQTQLEKRMSEPGFYQSEGEKIRQVTQELAQIQAQMEAAFSRWAELEDTKPPES